MKKTILFLFLILFVLTGCNTKTISPAPNELTQQEIAELVSQWKQFRKQNYNNVKAVIAESDIEKRKEIASQQCLKLNDVYHSWLEAGVVHKSSGMVIYGPRASGWMAEIIEPMRLYSEIISGSDVNVDKLKTPIFNKQYKLSLYGMNDAYCSIDTKQKLLPERTYIDCTIAILDSGTYPYNGTFNKTNIYLLPDGTISNAGNTGGLTGYSNLNIPGVEKNNQINICYPVSKGKFGFIREIGHVWYFAMNSDKTLDQWLKLRKPYVADEINDCQEVLAVDFALTFWKAKQEKPFNIKIEDPIIRSIGSGKIEGMVTVKNNWPADITTFIDCSAKGNNKIINFPKIDVKIPAAKDGKLGEIVVPFTFTYAGDPDSSMSLEFKVNPELFTPEFNVDWPYTKWKNIYEDENCSDKREELRKYFTSGEVG